jgi:hypothetical protein
MMNRIVGRGRIFAEQFSLAARKTDPSALVNSVFGMRS